MPRFIRILTILLALAAPLRLRAGPPPLDDSQARLQDELAARARRAKEEADRNAKKYIKKGKQNVKQGKEEKNQPEVQLGGMQILEGLLGQLAGVKMGKNADTAAGRSSSLGPVPTVTGSTSQQPLGNMSKNEKGSLGPGSPEKTPDLDQEALKELDQTFGLKPDKVVAALQDGTPTADILGSAPVNAPSPATLAMITKGMAQYGRESGTPFSSGGASSSPASLGAGSSGLPPAAPGGSGDAAPARGPAASPYSSRSGGDDPAPPSGSFALTSSGSASPASTPVDPGFKSLSPAAGQTWGIDDENAKAAIDPAAMIAPGMLGSADEDSSPPWNGVAAYVTLPVVVRSPVAIPLFDRYELSSCLPRAEFVLRARTKKVDVGGGRSVVFGEPVVGLIRYSLVCGGVPGTCEWGCVSRTRAKPQPLDVSQVASRVIAGPGAAKLPIEVSLLGSKPTAPSVDVSFAPPPAPAKQLEPKQLVLIRRQEFHERIETLVYGPLPAPGSPTSVRCFGALGYGPSECYAAPLSPHDPILSGLDPEKPAEANGSSGIAVANEKATIGAIFCAKGAVLNAANPEAAGPYYTQCQEELEKARAAAPVKLQLSLDIAKTPLARKALDEFEKFFGVTKEAFLKAMFSPDGGPEALEALLGRKLAPEQFEAAMAAALKDLDNRPQGRDRNKEEFARVFGAAKSADEENRQEIDALWKIMGAAKGRSVASAKAAPEVKVFSRSPTIFERASAKYGEIRVRWESEVNPAGRNRPRY